ncbi:hypothetical protein PYCC9005_005515 [Savitreella phatthalungensis]
MPEDCTTIERRQWKERRDLSRMSGRALMKKLGPSEMCFEHMHKIVYYRIGLFITEEDDGKLVLEPAMHIMWLTEPKHQPDSIRLHVTIDKETRSASVLDPSTGQAEPGSRTEATKPGATNSAHGEKVDSRVGSTPGRADPAPARAAEPFKRYGLDQDGFPGFLKAYCADPCSPGPWGLCPNRMGDIRIYVSREGLVSTEHNGLTTATLLTDVSITSLDSDDHWCCSYWFPPAHARLIVGLTRLPKIEIAPAMAKKLLDTDSDTTWTFSVGLSMTELGRVPPKLHTARLFFDSVRGRDAIRKSRRSTTQPQPAGPMDPSTESPNADDPEQIAYRQLTWTQIN